ncbi:MAG: hypothetical protein IKB99_04620 [Lentisphaeria bacterium]|nr:hypothetical protein [Lentisphaeria bacterium]
MHNFIAVKNFKKHTFFFLLCRIFNIKGKTKNQGSIAAVQAKHSKDKHIHPPTGGSFSSAALAEQLHPPSLKLWRDKQVSLLWCLVKMSRLHFITPWQGRKGCAF